MDQREYQAHYEAIERACKNGMRSWVSGMAAIAMHSIEYGRSCERAAAEAPTSLGLIARADRARTTPATTHTRFLGKLRLSAAGTGEGSRLMGNHIDHVGVIWPDGTRVAPISGGMLFGQAYTEVRIVREAQCREAEESKP